MLSKSQLEFIRVQESIVAMFLSGIFRYDLPIFAHRILFFSLVLANLRRNLHEFEAKNSIGSNVCL